MSANTKKKNIKMEKKAKRFIMIDSGIHDGDKYTFSSLVNILETIYELRYEEVLHDEFIEDDFSQKKIDKIVKKKMKEIKKNFNIEKLESGGICYYNTSDYEDDSIHHFFIIIDTFDREKTGKSFDLYPYKEFENY